MTLTRPVIVVLTMAVAIFTFAGCGSEPTPTLPAFTLPEDEWVLIESEQTPIYVRFVGISGKAYLFQSSDEPFEGNNPESGSMPKKYALGEGVIGETVILARRTTYYDVNPPKVETEVFVRFEVVSYDEATNVVTIRLLEPVS